ncbi:hypothetical protein Tco_1411673 [Tanacetum coccineum]
MSTENKKAGGNGNGRLMVEELSLSCDEVKNDRQRFEIELKEGETTIVSWTQLRIDSGLPLDSPSSPSSPPSPQRPVSFPLMADSKKDRGCNKFDPYDALIEWVGNSSVALNWRKKGRNVINWFKGFIRKVFEK